MRSIILTAAAIIMTAVASFAKENTLIPTLKAKGEVIKILHDGIVQSAPWVINPELDIDTLETTAMNVTLITPVDTLSLSTGKEWDSKDVAVITENGDTCLTRIYRIPADIYSNPRESMGRYKPGQKLTKAQAEFDVNALLYALRQIHPDIYSVSGQEKLLSAFERVKRSLPDSMTRVELYEAAAPLVSMIGDGHTMLRFPYNDVFTKDNKRLPLFMSIKSDRRMISTSCLDSIVPRGSEVVSIGGHTSDEMIDSMMKYVSGERDFFRVMRIDNEFPALFEMLYGGQPEYEVEFIRPGGIKKEKASVPAATWEEINKRNNRTGNRDRRDPYSYKIDEKRGVAVMDFNSFYNSKMMMQFCDSMFKDLKAHGIKKLIVDIRNNGGGDSSVGDVLFRYISPKPFTQFGKTLVNRTPMVIKLTGDVDRTPGIRFYEGREEDYIKPYTPEEGHFDGEVILLTSNHTFSSAASFAWAFKQFGMGKIIGEETGGMNVAYGDILTWAMPISRLYCTISWKRFWQAGADERDIHGALPDVATKADDAMEAAMTALSGIKYRSIDNKGNVTTVVLEDQSADDNDNITSAVLHNAGGNYKAKTIKQTKENGVNVYTLRFRRFTEYKDCSVTVTVNGKEINVPLNYHML